jgi:gliding motility-associated-like protein
VFTQNLKNILGCDSTVITTVVFDKSLIDTIQLSKKTCLPPQVGSFTLIVSGGVCDTVLIINTSLAPSYTLSSSDVTCKPALAGVFTQNLTTIYGCDSILTSTVVFDPSLIDSTFLTAQTCNPAQVGKTTKVLNGSNGCDSLVITNTTLAPPITNTVNQLTCKPNNAGTFIDTYNINGCDSVVTRIIVFDPSQIDTTKLTLTTCDPTQTGVLSTTLTGKDGCDSIVIKTTVFDPTLCAPTGTISSKSTSCADKIDGSVTFSLDAGSPPFQYNWTDGQGNTGTGQASLNTPVQITGLAPGSFTLNVTQATGPALVLQSTVSAPAPLSALAVPLQIYNGYSVRCAGDTDGSATLAASGGTTPYHYQWSNGDTLVTATNLSEGDYTVTITDRNNCPTTSIASISAPDPLTFLLAIERPKCGEQVANVMVTPLGGVQLYDILLDSKLLSSPTASIGSGTYNIVVQDANDCFADSTLDIVVPESGVISLPSDTIVQLGEVLTIEAQTNLTVWNSIRWSPAPDTSCVDCLSQTWKPLVSGIYSVTQIDTFGCISKATIRVIVKKTSPLYVPNIFSPDNLNDNDFFTIGGGPSVRQIEELRIFDRWGNVVYNLDAPIGPNEWPGWDGKQGNKAVSVGVYVYYIKVRLVTGELEVVEGDLTVIKN